MNKNKSWYLFHKEANKQKEPYKAVMVRYDEWVPVPGLEDERVDAVSRSQARYFFLNLHPKLKDYERRVEVDYQVDEEAVRQKQEIIEVQKQDKEYAIQNAWWNND